MNPLRTPGGRHKRRRPVRAASAALAAVLSISSLAVLAVAGPATAVTGAVSTSTNTAVTGPCLHGNPNPDSVNCNKYAAKADVWLSGLPHSTGDGSYFFAILEPGSQHDPNDGKPGNLSDTTASADPDSNDAGSGDTAQDRRFKLVGGVVMADGGNHTIANDKVQAINFDDTSNNGGVYILAVCSWNDGNAVDPHDCKYDAFKVVQGEQNPCPPDSTDPFCLPQDNPGNPLTVTKTASGAYNRAYTWGIDKSVDGAPVYGPTSATVNYDIKITSAQGAPTDRTVTGQITIGNTNESNVHVTVDDEVTIDHADPAGDEPVPCTVDPLASDLDGTYVPKGNTVLNYSCALPETLATDDVVSNKVTINWSDTSWAYNGANYFLAAGTDDETVGPIGFTANEIDRCVNVTDKFGDDAASTLDSEVCYSEVTQPGGLVIDDSKVVPYPVQGCVTVDNTATYASNDQDGLPTGSDPASQKVCRPYQATSGHTMGFWQNKNGLGVMSKDNARCLGLRDYLRTLNPFKDLSAGAACGPVTTNGTVTNYVFSRIKEASATGVAMNKMLKGQMLATALSVYYTGPGEYSESLKFMPAADLGGATIDLLHVCANPGTCSSFQDTSSVFGVPPATTGPPAATVSLLLCRASLWSTSGGGTWYANNKTRQGLAKNTFDAINNNVTYAP